jgi:hypothetical protein
MYSYLPPYYITLMICWLILNDTGQQQVQKPIGVERYYLVYYAKAAYLIGLFAAEFSFPA